MLCDSLLVSVVLESQPREALPASLPLLPPSSNPSLPLFDKDCERLCNEGCKMRRYRPERRNTTGYTI